MTPEKLAEIRAKGEELPHDYVSRLCDALEEAWAERDYERTRASCPAHSEDGQAWQRKRDLAFAKLRQRAERAEAALGRVRALCDQQGHHWNVDSRLIRATIEREQR